MATNRGANLRVRISADLEDIKKGLGLLRGELAKVKSDAARATPDTKAWESGLGRVRGALGNLAAAYVGIQSITRGIGALFSALERADQFDKLSQSAGVSVEVLSRLAYAAKLSGSDVDGLSRGLRKLSDDATKNKGLLGQLGIEIADAAGNARSADALFLDLADVFAALPDGVEKTALAMKLFGERIGPALVPLLNEGRQGLIDLGLEAERTGNAMTTAAAKGAVELSDNLDRLKLVATGLANEVAKNLIPALAGYAEAAAVAGQQSNVAAEGGKFLANAIKGIAAPVIGVKNLLEGLLNILLFLGTASTQVARLIEATLVRAVTGFGTVLSQIASGKSPTLAFFEQYRKDVSGVGADAKATLDGIRAGFSAMTTGVAESARDIAAIGKLFDDGAGKSAAGVQAVGKAAKEASPETAKLLALIRAILGGDGKSNGKPLADSMALQLDEIKRAQAELDQQYKDGLIGAAVYYGQRVALQQQLIDMQVEQLRGELALTKELTHRKRIEEKIVILQRDRAQVARDAAREQSDAEAKIRQLAASPVLLQDEVKRAQAALDQQFADRTISISEYYGRRVALEQQLIGLQVEQLRGELSLTKELDRRQQIQEQIIILQRDSAQVARDTARELNATQLEGLRNRASTLTGGLSAAEQSISAQVDAGSLGYLEGELRLRKVRARSLEQLRELRAEQAAYIASLGPGDPNLAAATEGLLGIDTAIANVHASMQQLRQDTMDVGVGALSTFFSSLRDGALSAGDAFRALVADFARGIYDMLAAATAKRLVGAIAGLFGGAGGGEQDVQQGAVALTGAAAATTIAGGAISAGAVQLSASAAQLIAAASALAAAGAVSSGGGIFGLAHGGGIAGALRMSRIVDPTVFGAAPRYHGGGIAGLDGNEIPAILQRGEIIRTRQQENALQARLNAGQAAAPVVRNVIVFDEAELADALSGSAGERVIVNHVRRNRGAVNG